MKKGKKTNDSRFYVGHSLTPIYYRLKKMRRSTFTRSMLCSGLSEEIKNRTDELYDSDDTEILLYNIIVSKYCEMEGEGKTKNEHRCAIRALSRDFFNDDPEAWRDHLKL